MKPQPTYAAWPPISSGSLVAPGWCSVTEPMPDPAVGPAHWSTFWRDFGEGDARPERCHIPGDGRQAVDRHWVRFADALPQHARVLDIGCGAGGLGRDLLASRADLHVTGIDFAEVPPAVDPRQTVRARVAMEALPFAAAAFDAAVSLFGIEYGDIAATTRELARVVKPGGRYGFVVHHCDSEIAREGTTRVNGIRDVLSGAVKAAFLAGDRVRLDRQCAGLAARYPGEPTVGLVSDYFRRQIGRSPAERQLIWRKLADDVAVEVALTAQMVKCARSPAQLGPWLVPLLEAMAMVEVSVLRRAGGEPIGWTIGGVR